MGLAIQSELSTCTNSIYLSVCGVFGNGYDWGTFFPVLVQKIILLICSKSMRGVASLCITTKILGLCLRTFRYNSQGIAEYLCCDVAYSLEGHLYITR